MLIRVQALVFTVFAAARCHSIRKKRLMATIESEGTLALSMMSGLSINANIARAVPRWC